MKKLFFLSLVIVSSLFSSPQEEKPIVVVIPSYKNYKWCHWNVNSVLKQEYSNFRVIYVDDCSPDSTANRVESIVKKHGISNRISYKRLLFDDENSKDIVKTTEKFSESVNEDGVFFTLVENKNRIGALANLYRSIWSCNDDEIIVTLDGDDWFSDHLVLKRLNEAYSSKNIWLTHGKMTEYPSGASKWSEPIPAEIIKNNAFRQFKCPSHLRTFYAWLFKRISLEDLVYNGEFFSMTWDMAMMYPMIEMAGDRHAFMEDTNYVYNMSNPINDNKVNAELQRMLDKLIRNKEPYKRLADK